MKKRLIAALVLASLPFWSVPAAMAITQHSSPAHSHAARMHDHSCCPGAHSRLMPVLVNSEPAEVPCNQHPCCVKQRPENSATLPAAISIQRPDANGTQMTVSDRSIEGHNGVSETSRIDSRQTYSARSTVLRI